jgi:hypothetical protein
MVTVAVTTKHDNVYGRFIHFVSVNSRKLTFSRCRVTAVLYRTVKRPENPVSDRLL